MTRREKTAQSNIKAWERSTEFNLWNAYESFSSKKQRAFDYCKELQYKYGGHDLKIISHNTFIFTAGFAFEDKETGACKFMFITPSYDTAVDMI